MSPLIRLLVFATLTTPAVAAPDLVVLSSKIATSDPGHPSAQAFAVTRGRFTYVGNAAGALKLVGSATRVVRLANRRVLPGLVDAHIHPLGIVDLDECDLGSKAKTLAEIANIVRECVARYHLTPGEWLNVQQWNYTNGNQPDADHPTLRAALDKGAPANPVQLLGNDGHHGAFNSPALALAATPDGKRIGLNRATLAGPFARLRELIGVDATGEPSGGVNESARAAMGKSALAIIDVAALMKAPERMTQRLNSAGITAFLDAAAEPESFPVYDALEARGQLTAHASLAQFYDPDVVVHSDGTPDYDRMVADAVRWRDHYAHDPLIRADTVKLFADGVMEGDPLATPPTLPNSPSLTPYLQPIFGRDPKGRATFAGRYVDPTSPECIAARAASPDPAMFMGANGFHPAQCLTGSGRLQHPRPVIMEFVRRMHAAGLALHIHAISDAAVRTAVDALEAARAGEPAGARRPDTLAHLQLVHPDDIARIGRDRLFLAMTYSWIYTDPEYDLSVIPFVQRVTGDGYAALHAPGSYYERHAYPVGSLKTAGATLVAGSDAPVFTRDPQPFVNMMGAVTRATGGTPALGPASERVTVADAIRAYTLDGARSLGREGEFGSISIGKSADFIVVDADPFTTDPARLDKVRVCQTWFKGRVVYRAAITTSC